MNASLQPVAADPPTFVLRLHPGWGSWLEEAPYNGSATVTCHGAVAVIRGLHADGWSEKTKSAVLETVAALGVQAIIGTHSGRLWIWTM